MPYPDRPQLLERGAPARHPAPLSRRVPSPATAADVAAAVVILWQAVDAALRPIIGQRGAIALFHRSVQLTAATYPWLATDRHDADAEMKFLAIADVFSQQEAAAAIAGGDALFWEFHQLLSTLIGESLTERLLRPAFGPTTRELPLQGPSS